MAVTVSPAILATGSNDVITIGAVIRAANDLAEFAITQLVPAASDEISVVIAGLFAAYGQAYQVLSTQAAQVHDFIALTLSAAATSYASAEATSVSLLR